MKKEKTTKKVQHQEEKNLITKNKSSKIFFIVAIILIAMFSLALAPVTLQNDTYYTIEIGKQIMETGVDILYNRNRKTNNGNRSRYARPFFLASRFSIYISSLVI